MPSQPQAARPQRLLVFNCHEPWVYQLSGLQRELDIVVGLEGRRVAGWDTRLRPIPPNGRLVRLPDVLASREPYYCIIAHNISDLLDVRDLPGPRLIYLHSTLEGRALEEGSSVDTRRMREVLHHYLSLVGGHAVASSELKARSWGVDGDIVTASVDVSAYPAYSGEQASGLRVANDVSKKKHVLLWSFHRAATWKVPIRLVGHNPDMPGVSMSEDWGHLKSLLQSHRFYIHTADPRYENGYNMASLEAMAAGMPILGNAHPGSPIRHGVSGFLSDDPEKLRRYAVGLLGDRDWARRLGAEARRVASEEFGTERFTVAISRAVEAARRKCASGAAGLRQQR